MCSALRFCLSVYLSLLPRGMGRTSVNAAGIRKNWRPYSDWSAPRLDGSDVRMNGNYAGAGARKTNLSVYLPLTIKSKALISISASTPMQQQNQGAIAGGRRRLTGDFGPRQTAPGRIQRPFNVCDARSLRPWN